MFAFLNNDISVVKFLKKSAIVCMSFLIAMVFLLPASARAGLGVSPGTLVVDGMSPGQEVTKYITFSRGDASEKNILDITIDGSVADAISSPSSLVLPSGQNNVALPVTINAGTLPAGSYTVKLKGAEKIVEVGSGVRVGSNIESTSYTSIAAQATIQFTVTNDEIQKFAISQVQIPSSEERQRLGFSFVLINSGNVDARPTSIDITITDQRNLANVIKETVYEDAIVPVNSFSDKEVTIFTAAQLDVGRYWVDFVFYNGDEVIYTHEKYALQIFPAGTLEQKGELLNFSSDKEVYAKDELIVYEGSFKNTGTVGLSAAMVTDLSKGDERVDLIKTDEAFVPPGRTAEFFTTQRLSDGGSYLAKGKVSFGIFESNEIESEFVVDKLPVVFIIIALSAVTLLFGGIIWWVNSLKHRKKKSKHVDKSK